MVQSRCGAEKACPADERVRGTSPRGTSSESPAWAPRAVGLWLQLAADGPAAGDVLPDGAGHHGRLPPAVHPPFLRNQPGRPLSPGGPRVDGRPGAAPAVGG